MECRVISSQRHDKWHMEKSIPALKIKNSHNCDSIKTCTLVRNARGETLYYAADTTTESNMGHNDDRSAESVGTEAFLRRWYAFNPNYMYVASPCGKICQVLPVWSDSVPTGGTLNDSWKLEWFMILFQHFQCWDGFPMSHLSHDGDGIIPYLIV